MTTRAITVDVPEPVYDQLRRAAEKTQRTVTELVVEAMLATAPTLEHTNTTLHTAIAQLAHLNDAALWQAARTTVPPAQRERLASLHDTQQREGLSAAEQAEEQALVALYQETVLVRAQAAVLLHQRGYDVRDPQQFAPLA